MLCLPKAVSSKSSSERVFPVTVSSGDGGWLTLTAVGAGLVHSGQRRPRPIAAAKVGLYRRLRFLGVIAALCLVAAACGSEAGPSADESGPETVTAAEGLGTRTGDRPTVTLGVTDWTGAKVTAALAELLIERQLGYPVEVAQIGDNRQMLDDLESGALDAVLEVWAAGFLPESTIRLQDGEVSNLGELGVVAEPGWFIPRYLLDEDPGLEDWEAYRNAGATGRFASAETGNLGRFLATDPSWEQRDEALIDALSLALQVVYSGSEEATIAELSRATAAGEPILVYWWSPTAEVIRFDLVPVELPERDDECLAAAEAGELEVCEYATEPVLKLGAADLAERLPDLNRFLSRFELSTEDQLFMIDEIDNRGVAVTAAVERWVEENRADWQRWLE